MKTKREIADEIIIAILWTYEEAGYNPSDEQYENIVNKVILHLKEPPEHEG